MPICKVLLLWSKLYSKSKYCWESYYFNKVIFIEKDNIVTKTMGDVKVIIVNKVTAISKLSFIMKLIGATEATGITGNLLLHKKNIVKIV